MRILFAFMSWVGILFVSVITLTLVVGFAYGIPLGFGIGMFLIFRMAPHFLVSVPEVTGLLTINLRTGELRPYGPGMHFRFPWEQIKERNYIPLLLITQKKEETYPAKDGPALKVEWEFQYAPSISGLPRFKEIHETTITNGIIGVGSSFLGVKIAKQNAVTSVNNRKKIEEELLNNFEETTFIDKKEGSEKSLEDFYGIDLKKVSLINTDYEDKYQRARTSEAVAKKINKIAEKLQEGKNITDKDAKNLALIINGDIIKNVQEVEGQGGQALAALLMAMARGGKNG